METKIATSVNQSKTLIELGVDVNTADMYYHKCYSIDGGTYDLSIPSNSGFKNKHFFDDCPNEIPAWSLSALIELMPKYLLNDDDEEFGLEIVTTYKNEYEVCYQELLPPIYNSSLFNAIFEMVCYLLENKLIN